MSDNSILPLPARFAVKCEMCGDTLDTRKEGVHEWTAGWVMQRMGGGGHGISLPQRSGRFAHRHCVEAAARPLSNQRSMF